MSEMSDLSQWLRDFADEHETDGMPDAAAKLREAASQLRRLDSVRLQIANYRKGDALAPTAEQALEAIDGIVGKMYHLRIGS